MNNSNPSITGALNRLLTNQHDVFAAQHDAHRRIGNLGCKRTMGFLQQARQREAIELARLVSDMRGKPRRSRGLRRWRMRLAVRAARVRGDRGLMKTSRTHLNELYQGYQQVLQSDPPAPVRMVLRRHSLDIVRQGAWLDYRMEALELSCPQRT